MFERMKKKYILWKKMNHVNEIQDPLLIIFLSFAFVGLLFPSLMEAPDKAKEK